MELITALTYMSQAAEGTHKIYNFIKGGQLATTLQAIGDIELEEAIDVFNGAKRSSDFKEEISRATTLLISARGKIRPKKSWFRESLYPIGLSEGYEKSCQTAVAIAICYKYLGERTRAIEFLEKAVNDFEKAEEVFPLPQDGSMWEQIEQEFEEKRKKLKKACRKISPTFRYK